MKRKSLSILVGVLSVVLVTLVIATFMLDTQQAQLAQPTTTAPTQTTAPTPPPTTAPPTTVSTTPPETEPPTEPPTEPEPVEERFWLSFAGDCTLGSTKKASAYGKSFIKTIGTDYDYPFANVRQYFENDEFTIVNLEGVFTDSGTAANKLFAFRGPTAYTQILTGSSVEAVTLANNHSKDYGNTGYQSTKDVLTQAGVSYVEENKTTLFTTKNGLVIGLYADAFKFTKSDIQKNIQSLKNAGADVIICAFHWGTEGSYRPTAAQKTYAKAAVNAGAHIVYGHHPHVLQPVVRGDNSVIMYSLGNFSFGGSNSPQDYDAALIQQEVIRDPDGKIRLGDINIVPLSVSSSAKRNNFQPTPYEVDSKAYNRAMSKLDGTFKGKDLVVDYSKDDPAPTTPTESQPASGGTDTSAPPAAETPKPPAAETPAPPAADSGSVEGA